MCLAATCMGSMAPLWALPKTVSVIWAGMKGATQGLHRTQITGLRRKGLAYGLIGSVLEHNVFLGRKAAEQGARGDLRGLDYLLHGGGCISLLAKEAHRLLLDLRSGF